MSENSETQLSSVSGADSYEAIGEFWDTHSSADYWDQGYDVEFEVSVPHRHRVSIEVDLFGRLAEVARHHDVSSETLVNLWIAERLNAMDTHQVKHTEHESAPQPLEPTEKQLAEKGGSYSAE